MTWDPSLVGSWEDLEDKARRRIECGERKSYNIHCYVYTIETGDVTGYLTTIGDQRFLDVTLARGEDRRIVPYPGPRDPARAAGG